MDRIKEMPNSTVNRTIGNQYYYLRLTRGEPSGRVIKQKPPSMSLKGRARWLFVFGFRLKPLSSEFCRHHSWRLYVVPWSKP